MLYDGGVSGRRQPACALARKTARLHGNSAPRCWSLSMVLKAGLQKGGNVETDAEAETTADKDS